MRVANDFGLSDVCGLHTVVFLDASGMTLHQNDSIPNSELYTRKREFLNERIVRYFSEQEDYLVNLHTKITERNVVITEYQLDEIRKMGDVRNMSGITRQTPTERLRHLLAKNCEAAEWNVFNHTVEEKYLIEDICQYFEKARGKLSDVDYKILMSVIATSIYRGPTALITNDMEFGKRLDGIKPYLRKGFRKYFTSVNYPIRICTTIRSDTLWVYSEYLP